MAKMMAEFKKEHEIVNQILQDVKRKGVHTMEGRNALVAAKDKLPDHMKKEVEEL